LRLSWLHIWLHAWLRSGFQRKEKKPLCGKGSRKKKKPIAIAATTSAKLSEKNEKMVAQHLAA
jgi:hypothetical protein